jgi:hypothetical protein
MKQVLTRALLLLFVFLFPSNGDTLKNHMDLISSLICRVPIEHMTINNSSFKHIEILVFLEFRIHR